MDGRIDEILVVDDRDDTANAIKRLLTAGGPEWKVDTARGVNQAVDKIRARLKDGSYYSVVVTDLQMETDDGGIRLIQEIQRIDPLAISILYSSHGNLLKKTATAGLGAFDVVPPGPSSQSRILERVQTALRYRAWAERSTVLKRYFDPRLFEMIENDPSVLKPRSGDLTIVFWDVRGFSELCEKFKADPDIVAGFLGELCDTAARLVFECGGVLDKFMGDGIMALFGVFAKTPEEQKVAVLDAAIAAARLSWAFEQLVSRRMRDWRLRTTVAISDISVRLACGIHWNRVLVGNLGTEYRDQFTAVGAPVNFAQRLEALAGKEVCEGHPADILLSQPAREHIYDMIPVHNFGSREIRGFEGKHAIYTVRREDVMNAQAVITRRSQT